MPSYAQAATSNTCWGKGAVWAVFLLLSAALCAHIVDVLGAATMLTLPRWSSLAFPYLPAHADETGLTLPR